MCSKIDSIGEEKYFGKKRILGGELYNVRYITPMCVMNLLTLLNIVLLACCLYKFSKLESLAILVFR